MSNPRLIHRIDELHTQRATFGTDETIAFDRNHPYGTAKVGSPVVVDGEMVVGLAEEGAAPFGALERVYSDGSCVVAYHGAIEYAGTVSPGAVAIAADGHGGIKAAEEGGRAAYVVSGAVTGKTFVIQ